MTNIHSAAPFTKEKLTGLLTFIQEAERLKDQTRSGSTRGGRSESVADHSWRLALLAMVVTQGDTSIDQLKLLKLCLVHDLGEALGGDIPAIAQDSGDDRDARERQDLETLCAPLTPELRKEIIDLWQEYSEGSTPEAIMAKGLDKIETMLQHNLTRENPDIDFAFNLGYGTSHTSRHPVLAQIREQVDRVTAKIADERKVGAKSG